ncbi:MAG: lipoate--protein ligase family protein, partial [Candidatus Latescibacterota bacterium]
MRWRLLETGFCGAAYNMAVDEAILLTCIQGEVPPTVRFYGWKPAAVSVGYFQ